MDRVSPKLVALLAERSAPDGASGARWRALDLAGRPPAGTGCRLGQRNFKGEREPRFCFPQPTITSRLSGTA